jgi:cell division protein FtsB
MNESKENPRRYRWPWFVLAAIIIFFVLAIVCVSFKAEQIKQQRDYNAPLPSSAPAR